MSIRFQDAEHDGAGLAFYRVREIDGPRDCDEAVQRALVARYNRAQPHEPTVEPLRLDDSGSFRITWDAQTCDHWPVARPRSHRRGHTMTIRFNDSEHSVAGLAFYTADERDPATACDAPVQEAIGIWHGRPNRHEPALDCFRLHDSHCFRMNWRGEASDYWPDREANFTSEALVREFLFRGGICTVADEAVRLYAVLYGMMGMDSTENLLVCPYPTASGNIGGIVIVGVDKHIVPAAQRGG
jgi:hypothetical protein